MFERIGAGLKDALRKMANAGYVDRKVVDELVRDIQRSLIGGDVDVKLVFSLTETIRKRALDEKPPAGVTPREHLVKIVYEELVRFVGSKPEIALKPQRILLCGLFGSGKTTTVAKLARFFTKKGLSVGVVCCDVERPAAFEQLQQLAEQVHVPFYGEKTKDSSRILANALGKLRTDVVIIDSSGRDALDARMIGEIKKLYDVAKPDERILVIPADIGQAARVQAEAFQKALSITGVIITKMDGTAKGGGALTACAVTGAPVKWIGIGEKVDAFEQFDPERFISRLIGFGDLQGLLEKAKETGAEKTAKKIVEGRFTLVEFYEQIKSMQGMGSLRSVMDMVPGMGGMKLPKGVDLEKQEGKLKRWSHAIDSMTPEEREDPDKIDASRIKRISKGSGVPDSEIRELIKNFEQAKKVMKMMSGGGKRGMLGKLARRFSGR